MFLPQYPISLGDGDRAELARIAAAPTSPQRLATRARIVLASAEGRPVEQIASQLGVSTQTVCQWRKRFCREGLGGIEERKRSGRKRSVPRETLEGILRRAVRGTGAAQGKKRRTQRPTTRNVAREFGVSKDTVSRLWRANDLRPHLLRTFKLSNDPEFDKKFWDVIGLYLNPPEKALVLCCDEKSQCQALERTQPGLPLGMGHICTQTHDYYRHGTLTLFAALDYLSGKIISRTESRHRHEEWLRFLKQLNRETPKELDLHLIVDNYATHKHPDVRQWTNKHPRFHTHFIPTSSSWMNLIERFFRDITEDVIRAGSFASVRELAADILDYLDRHNLAPKRYVWRKSGQEIMEKILRARARLEEIKYSKDN